MEPVPTRIPVVPPARRRPVEQARVGNGQENQPLYRHGGILVTFDVLVVGGSQYAIDGLQRLRTARSTSNPVTAWIAVLAGAVFAAVGVGISLVMHSAGPSRATYLVLAVAVGVPVLVVFFGGRRARRSHQLWADHQGRATLLYASTDLREFGQVCRAVLRAHEAAERRAGRYRVGPSQGGQAGAPTRSASTRGRTQRDTTRSA